MVGPPFPIFCHIPDIAATFKKIIFIFINEAIVKNFAAPVFCYGVTCIKSKPQFRNYYDVYEWNVDINN